MRLDSYNKFLQVIPKINWKTLAFDIETDGLNSHTLNMEGFSLYDGQLGLYVDLTACEDVQSVVELLFNYLSTSNENLIGHNLTFDLKGLARYVGIDRLNEYLVKVKLWDTYLGAYLLDERTGHKLKGPGGCTEIYLAREVRANYETSRQFGPSSVEFAEYAVADVIDAWDLLQAELKLLKEQNLMFTFETENRFLPVQIEMEWNGVKIDTVLLKELEEKLDIMKGELQEEIIKCLGPEVVPQQYMFGIPVEALGLDSPQKMTKLLQTHFKLEVTNADSQVFEDHLGEHPFFELMLKYRACSKILNTFVTPYWDLIDENATIYPEFHIVRTGRVSCTSPNLMNIAKESKWLPDVNVRKLFVPREGNKFLKIDFSGQELRIMASYSKDPTMLRAFEMGYDLHLFVANRSLGLCIDESKLTETHPEFASIKEKYSKERTSFKAVNFGILYGKQPFSFSLEMGISMGEAKRIIDGFYDTFPNVWGAKEYVKGFQAENGYVATETGRRRRFDTPCTAHDFRAGFNQICQGEAATQKKRAAGDLWRYFQKFTLKPRIRLDIHDELIMEAPEEHIEKLVAPAEKIMTSAIKYNCPMAVESKIVSSYGG